MNMTHRTRDLGHKTATAAFSLIAFLLLAGCEQPTDADTDDAASKLPAGITLATATPATADSILGSWTTLYTGSGESSLHGEYTYVEEKTLFINSDGSFTSYRKQTHTSKTDPTNVWTEYYAEKGTYTFTEGVITWTRTHSSYTKDAPFDPITLPSDEWHVYASSYIESEPIVIIDGKLCPGAFRRAGTGTGLIGTWSKNSFQTQNGETEYRKLDHIFTDTTFTYNHYISTSTVFGEPKYTGTFSYTLPGNNKIIITINDKSQTDDIMFAGDWLVLGDSNIYTKVNP